VHTLCPFAELRTREHFHPRRGRGADRGGQSRRPVEAAKGKRYGHRDSTMILLTYRHGLRAAKVCDLRWDQVDFNGAVLHVRRIKNGTTSTHPIQGDELQALRRLQRESPCSCC
jgi:integrase